MIRASAALLIVDRNDRVLILETAYKTPWELPGGGVEPGETPAEAASREAHEELGVMAEAGRLLCVDHVPPRAGRATPMLHFIFQGPPAGQLDPTALAHPPNEILAHRFAGLEEAVRLLGPRLGPRCRHAFAAAHDQPAAYLESGQPPTSPNPG